MIHCRVSSLVALSGREREGFKSITYVPTMKYDTSVRGHHSMQPILLGSFHLLISRPTLISHRLTTPSSPPLTTQFPSGLTLTQRATVACWNLDEQWFGKGFKLLGLGSFGMRELGSMLSLTRCIRGARYKSSCLLNRCLMNWSYAGTKRREEYFFGR